MKNQYVGDINDYHKYGLLRSIKNSTGFNILVSWMSTQDDMSKDGGKTEYLNKPKKWKIFDPELFEELWLIVKEEKRLVSEIEKTASMSGFGFYSEYLHPDATSRKSWFRKLLGETSYYDLIFFDPDNGIEVKSVKFGTKKSNKYAYLCELKEVWKNNNSIIFFQHFPRKNKGKFVVDLKLKLKEHLENSSVISFSATNVVFFLALQPFHQKYGSSIIREVGEKWKNEFIIR
ncbi:hypothetical protein ACSSZE_16465 [Acidithiobacillus caldus]